MTPIIEQLESDQVGDFMGHRLINHIFKVPVVTEVRVNRDLVLEKVCPSSRSSDLFIDQCRNVQSPVELVLKG
jgi:hypothetical protein